MAIISPRVISMEADFTAVDFAEAAGTPVAATGRREEEMTDDKSMKNPIEFSSTGSFNIADIAASLPETATTLLIDQYLTNRDAASARVFRVYKPTPPHYHATCDEYLYVFSGRGIFWMKNPESQFEFHPGHLLFFERGTVHAIPDILEAPLIFLSIDTPRRDPKDVIFVKPEDGTPESFIQANQIK
jgi:mannose-6-phosphate isomerase-like protein (cupin superfamily)